MTTKLSRNRKFGRMFVNILSILVMLTLAFPVTGIAYAQDPAPGVGLVFNAYAMQENDFNWMARQGLLQAETELGVSASEYQPSDQSEYDAALQQCADENDLCIAVGFDYGVSLANAARANTSTQWSIVDYSYPDCWEGAAEGVDCGSFSEIPNVRGLTFNEKQAGYLAGVLAGEMTATNVVGAVGGMEIPPVIAFVEGYRNGAQCTNPAVNVLSTYTGTFVDPDLGASTAQDLIGQGADIIFGAAGLTGNGAILNSAQNGQWAIGVDTDQYFTVFGNGTVTGADKILSSAMKRVDSAVYQTIYDFVNGTFSSGAVIYDLAVDGVGLAPFHGSDGNIPQEVKDELDAVKQGIIAGTVNIDNSCVPPPSPWLTAFPEWDFVEGFEWPLGASVSLTIDDPSTEKSPDLVQNDSAEPSPWGDPRTYVSYEFAGIYNLKPGDVVTLSDGVTERTHTVQNLVITAVDDISNTLIGTADIGAVVNVWPHETGEQVAVTTDAYGVWQVDLTGAYDIVPGSGGRAEIRDEFYNGTAVDWFVPNPHFTVFPEWDFFDGLEWPDGAIVTITVKDKPECETTRESGGGFFNGNFGEGCDVVVGDEVTFEYGETILTHTVQNLVVTNADVMTNAVGGTADPGTVIDVWPHETGQQLQATTADGNWQVDFTGLFDLVPGTCGRSQISVGVNATAVDWCAPKPWLIAFPENEAVEGWEWPVGATVTLTIDNAPENFVQSGTAEVTTWGDPRTYVRFDFWEEYNLQIGDVVTLTDGTITRTHIVQNLSVTDVHAEADTLRGMANPGAMVTMWPHGYDQIATLQTTAGEDGAWTGEFASVGFNLVPGIGGRSEVGDEFGNWTAVDWGVYMDGWQQINDSGFGDAQKIGVPVLEVFQGHLYASAGKGTNGAEVWRLGNDGQWSQVSEPGFGNDLPYSMIIDLDVFKGWLYAGVGWAGENWIDPAGQMWRSHDGTNWEPVTTNGFGNDETIGITNFIVYKGMLYAGTGGTDDTSAQIWRSSTGDSDAWEQVAPNGFSFTGNVTGFAAYKDVLYAAVEPSGGVGAPMQVWRSTNGSDWVTVTSDGFGMERNESTGGFAQFDGYLYLGVQNEDTGAQLWRTADGMYWEQVIDNGFGDLNNIKIEALLVYGDAFYAATKNITMGMQLWRSADGTNWEQVIADGFGDSGNFATLWNSAIAQYQGNLVIGTWNYNEGGEVWMFTP